MFGPLADYTHVILRGLTQSRPMLKSSVKWRHNSFAAELTIRPLTALAADNVEEKAEYRANFTYNILCRILY